MYCVLYNFLTLFLTIRKILEWIKMNLILVDFRLYCSSSISYLIIFAIILFTVYDYYRHLKT
jgi:hypothetical protein